MHGADRGIVTLPERFETFYQREFRSVVGLAYALSGSRWAAEDLAQEAFIAAHRKWDRIGEYESPGAWVRRVVANMAVSLYRKRASEARALARVAVRRQVSYLRSTRMMTSSGERSELFPNARPRPSPCTISRIDRSLRLPTSSTARRPRPRSTSTKVAFAWPSGSG